MDRRRAAAALIALAACFACSAAAPTSDHTALATYEGTQEGCYYNFQHYREGDRIMTNEPCLNCTCHNRMLMCYLRVCPFTKAIGQDCTVEKRGDQCCPIVTCPDIPVDLLTSTSTSYPAEYGGTGLGKVDNYGCTINGKYLPEGSKVPQTPNKPCEHCYCIRNMTTCVMQECTLHVDGCTPIYHRDVCCPVRYSCDHPEDETLLLDDMTTTVRPTPGFLLTTTTEEPITTQTQPRRECIENDQIHPDGALIKTGKPCDHCYCMKGDIVCVVQECGAPMENEGKNCTSLPPREGQCCPETYICEGDELPEDLLTTLQPPRRVSVEGSGYRNEPDESTFTEVPTFASETEGSGEELQTEIPLDSNELFMKEKLTTKESIDILTTEGVQYSSITTSSPKLELIPIGTTEPDKGENTVEEESYEPSTTPKEESKTTESTIVSDQDKFTSGITVNESSEPSMLDKTTIKDENKTTKQPPIAEEYTTHSETYEGATESSIQELTTLKDKLYPTDISDLNETGITIISDVAGVEDSEHSISKLTTLSDEIQVTEKTIIAESDITPSEEESPEPQVTYRTTPRLEFTTESAASAESEQESVPSTESDSFDSTKYSSQDEVKATEPTSIIGLESVPSRVAESDSSQTEVTMTRDEIQTTSLVSVEHTTPGNQEISGPSILDKTTSEYDTSPTIINEHRTTSNVRFEEERTESSIIYRTTNKDDSTVTEPVITSDGKQTTVRADEDNITTESALRIEDQSKEPIKPPLEKEVEIVTTIMPNLIEETAITSDAVESSSKSTIASSLEQELKPATTELPEKHIIDDSPYQITTGSPLETSDIITSTAAEPFTSTVDNEIDITTSAAEKQELPETPSINLEDNEIGEDISPILSPGRIPGEGDCLANGITYRNESSIPSTNKCYSSCKCVSSIIKCDPIICSPQPEYMDNCQPIFDTPDSCCPTYVCDHSRETIPPQPHSQMSGTESPLPSPSIECNGDECEVRQEKQPSEVPSDSCTSGACLGETVQKPEVSECGPEGCGESVKKPLHPPLPHPEECTGEKCVSHSESCKDGKCQLPPSQIVPTEESQSCENSDDCKKTEIPEVIVPICEGESCKSPKDEICDKSTGCEVSTEKPDETSVPTSCEGDSCKETQIPDTGVLLCEGESCKETGSPATDLPFCEGDSCKETQIPDTGVLLCEGESCKETGPPATDLPSCEGDSCKETNILEADEDICEGDSCKETKIPDAGVLPCEGESCKDTGIPATAQPSCEGDSCKETKTPDTGISACEGDSCKQTSIPTTASPEAGEPPCEADLCKKNKIPDTGASPCEGESCQEASIPATAPPSCNGDSCENTNIPEAGEGTCEGDSCKETKIPDTGVSSCEGESCKETGIPATAPPPCDGDSCKDINIPETSVSPCEGNSCKEVHEDCSTGVCVPHVTVPSQPSQEGETCTEENGCKKPNEIAEECADEECTTKDTHLEPILPPECKDSDCIQKPPSHETTIVGQLGTELPITEQTPLETIPSGEHITENENLDESTVTNGHELPESTTSSSVEALTSIPIKPKTEKPYKSSDLPESITTEKQDVTTGTAEDKVQDFAPGPYVPEFSESEQETSSQESEVVTEPSEMYVTESKTQKDNKPTEEVITETHEYNTELPASTVTDRSPVLTTEQEKYTDHEAFTEKPEDTSTPVSVSIHEPEDVYTELPISIVTLSEETTKAPEIPVVQEQESATETPELLTKVTESTLAKGDNLSTKLPVIETDQEMITETPVIATEATFKPEIGITESAVDETQEIHTKKPDHLEDSVTKIQEFTTESLVEKEVTTKLPISLETVSEHETPAQPETSSEAQTQTTTRLVTSPQNPYTNIPSEEIGSKKTTIIPEITTGEQGSQTFTLMPDVSMDEEIKTITPETTKKDDTTKSPEELGSKPTDQNLVNVEHAPQDEVTTQAEEISSAVTDEHNVQQEIKTELPVMDSEENKPTMPDIAITEEEFIQTESPMSLVTKLQQTDVTVTLAPISEHKETATESAELFTEGTKVTATEEIQIKTERPEPHPTEPQQMVTELPSVPFTEQEAVTHIPDISVSTDSPQTFVTEQETLVPQRETELPQITVQPEIGTEAPLLSVTEIEEPSVPSSEIPVSLFTESESVNMVTETADTSLTEKMEQPGETEIQTELPIYASTVETEQHELATNAPSVVPEQKYTVLPELVTAITTISDTGSQEESTKVPSIITAESQSFTTAGMNVDVDKTTEKPEVHPDQKLDTGTLEIFTKQQQLVTELPVTKKEEATESFTMGPELVTELHELHETIPEKEETPEGFTKEHESVTAAPDLSEKESTPEEQDFVTKLFETITEKEEKPEAEQGFVTELPVFHEPITEKEEALEFVTKEQKLVTELPESHETVPVKEETPEAFTIEHELITKLPESHETEKEELPATEPNITEYTAISAHEYETKGPEESTESHEFDIKTEEPTKEPETQTEIEISRTTLPAPLQTHVSEQQEVITTEPSKLTTPPLQVHDTDEKEKQTESSVLTESTTKQQEFDQSSEFSTESPILVQTEVTKMPQAEITTLSENVYSETTPYLVELQEHPHKVDEEPTIILPSEEPTTIRAEEQEAEEVTEATQNPSEQRPEDEIQTEPSVKEPEKPHDEEETATSVEELTEPHIPEVSSEPSVTATEEIPDSTKPPLSSVDSELDNKYGIESQEDQERKTTPTATELSQEEKTTPSIYAETTIKPLRPEAPLETTAPEEAFIPAKATTSKLEEEALTESPALFTKPEERPSEMYPPTPPEEISKPGFSELPPTEAPSPEEEGQFPNSGGYGQEPDYVEEDQAFGPGTCRYGGKVYVSAQQIPRDDPCDFCFCFRSDIICLQQSCPPPIHGCHEEPIQGFCCPRYECPVSMAVTLNVTTTTTTTTTTLPPHFLPHAYKGAAQRRGCQIKGHTYKVGEVVRASSGPCLHCTCGGDGQMKCDPKVCTPEPMLRQMIAAAVSAKRRR